MTESIYRRPDDYDLEHEGDTEDVAFFVELPARLRPRRVLELACGSGRVTLPLAEAGGFDVVGLELNPDMLAEARARREAASPPVQKRLTLVEGDMRSWRGEQPFDLVLSPCSSMCHLLALEDQLAAWRNSHANLAPGGRFVVDVSMADLTAYADSLSLPPRERVEVDRDVTDQATGDRLIRYRTTRYLADEQRAQLRYVYEKYAREPRTAPERYVSDYASHVYFPREMLLLFLHTGFEVESVAGDYQGRPLGPASRQLIVTGRKPAGA